MDKSVLLVLLVLQVFLLITAFTSADASTLGIDDQRPPDPVGRRKDRNRKGKGRKHFSNCSWSPGGCGVLGSKGQPPPPPPPPLPPTRPPVRVVGCW